MNGKIRGITIEIGANTQKLRDALSTADTQSRKLQTELKDIQKLLKLDSSNVTLMAQKQEVLAKSVDAVRERLTALRAAQADVNALYQNGDITEDVYRAYQREIADTEISLRSLEGRLASANGALSENNTATAENARQQRELAQTIEKADAKLSQEQAELERDTAALGQNASQQDKLRLKRESLTRQVELQREKVEALRTQTEELSRAEGVSEQAIAEQRAELARAETALNGYERELQNTVREMSVLNRAAAGFTAFGGKAEAAGRAMMPVSVAVAGMGVAAVKTGASFDSAMSQVAATMGMTAQEVENGCADYERLRQAAKDAGETTKFSAAQGAEALNYLALAGYDTTKAIDALPTVLNLAAAGNMELGYASDMVTDSMSALGLETEELVGFSDELAKTSQKSNTSIAQLGEAIITVGGTAKDLVGGTVELNAALGILADNGIKGSDGGTALRQVILNLTAPTDKAAALMKDLGLSAFDADGNMRPLNETFKDLAGKLEGLNDQDRKNILSTIFDARQLKSAEALLANCGGRFDELSGYIANADGAAGNMAETMNGNLKGQLTLLISQIQGVAIKLTEILMPAIRNIVTKISEWVDKFSQLDTGTQKMVLAIAGMVAAAGPLLIVIGKIATGIGAVLSVLGSLGGAGAGIGGVGAALTALTGPVGLTVAAVGGLAAAGAALYNVMNDSAVPAVDLFADKITYAADGTRILEQEISDTTATAVGAYMDLERNAGESLAKIASMGDVITEEQTEAFQEHCNTVKDSYGQMKDMVCQKLSEQYDQEKALLAKSFADSNALTEQQEAAILANLAEKQAAEQEAVAAQYAQINAIVAQAEAEKRALSLSEMQQIQAIQEEQKTNAVKTLSDTEMEARVILERMKSYNETVSIEIAAKTIQEAENARKAVVDEADQKYKDEIALALRMKEELGVIDDETYQQMVDDAQKRKDDTVKLAEKTKEETVAAMLAQNAELEDAVDTSTGDILTKWDVFKRNTIAKWNEISSSMSETTAIIKQSIVKEFTELKEDVVNKLGMLKNAIALKFNEMVQKVKSFATNMKQAGKELIQGLIDGITEKIEAAVTKVKNLCEGIVTAARAVFDEHSPSRVFHEIGAYVSQGLAEGIADAGDLAVGEMEALAGKIISTGDALSTGILSKDAETGQILYDNLYTNTMNRIDLYYRDRDKRIALMDDGTEENIKSMQREVKETQKATDLRIKLYQQEYKAKMQLLDEESSEAVKALQDELDAIDAEEEQKQRQQEALEYEEKMNGLRKKLHFASEEERVTIAEEIRRAEADRQKVLDKQALQDKKDSIRQQMEQVREEAAEKKKALQEELEAKEYQLQQQRTAEVEHMNVVIALMQKQVETKKEMEKLQTDIVKQAEQIQTDELARQKEEQTKKELTEIEKQERARKESVRQKNIAEKSHLEEQYRAMEKSYMDNEKLLNQWLGTYKQGQEDMTACLQEEAAKRQAYSSHELFPAASENGSGDLFPAQIEEQNALSAGQTEFKVEQWDVQTAYQAQKEQEQTKTAAQEGQKQSDNFITQWKRCEMEFQNGLNRMRNLFQEFSASLQALSSQWGRYFYEGIASTEDDIVKYINKMVKKMREALENASYAAQGDFGERSIDGSHRNGLAYVPFDNYNAILHKGEAVLTAAENQAYRTGKGTGDKNVSVYVTQNIYSPTPDARQEQKRAAREFKKIALERC